MSYLMVAGGLVLLVVCGDMLVRGAVALSLRAHVPPLLIGLTVVAFGTSAPELVVCLDAAFSGLPGIATGNVVGSNIANILLVLGLPAIIYPIAVTQTGVRRNAVAMAATAAVFILLCFMGPLALVHGLIMLALLVVYLAYSAFSASQSRKAAKASAAAAALADQEAEDDLDLLGDDVDPASLPKNLGAVLGLLAAGLIGLPIGAHYLVEGASTIARTYGISDTVIGLTLVAVGTSLPELAATIAAAMKRHSELAIGNVIGSNIFNILAIMGVTSSVATIPVPPEMLRVDLWVMAAATVIALVAVFSRRPIGRIAGTAFVLAYGFYTAWLYTTGGTA